MSHSPSTHVLPNFSSGGGEANTSSNELPDSTTIKGLANPKVGVDLPFKVLEQGANITLVADADKITISSVGGGSGTDEVLLVPIADKIIPINTSIIVGDRYELNSGIDLDIEAGANLTVI